MTDSVVASHAFVFFVGGFETTSGTLSFVFYNLALHPEVMEKCRAEVREVLQRHGGTMTYDSLKDMTYIQCVIDGKKIKILSTVKILCEISLKMYPMQVNFLKLYRRGPSKPISIVKSPRILWENRDQKPSSEKCSILLWLHLLQRPHIIKYFSIRKKIIDTNWNSWTSLKRLFVFLYFDGSSTKPRIFIAVFQNLCYYFIFSRKNKSSVRLEIYPKLSANRENKSRKFPRN